MSTIKTRFHLLNDSPVSSDWLEPDEGSFKSKTPVKSSGKAIKSKRRQKYQVIDSDLWMRLLRLVDEENMTIWQASDVLNVKYSTAKTILQLFWKTGRINWMNNPYSTDGYFVFSSKDIKLKTDKEADD